MSDPTLVLFYKEQTSWPFVHAVVFLALYFATRDIVLTLLLIYVWETFEFLLSNVWPYLRESMWDKMVGDPVIGSLSVLAFWVLDQATGWDDTFVQEVNPWWRFFGFVAVSVPGWLIVLDKRVEGRDWMPLFGTALYALVYIGLGLAIYSDYLSGAVGDSVLAWLAIVAFLALFAIPALPWPGPFMRVLAAELLVLAITFGVFIQSISKPA